MATGSYWENIATDRDQPARQNDGGFWDNVSGALDVVKELPAGLVKFAGGVAQVPVGFARLGADAVKEATGNGEGFSNDFGSNLGDYFPVLEQFRQSAVNTLGDVRHPSRLVDAYQQGQLAPKLLEDVGNATLVSGGLSKALTAASGAEAAGVEGATQAARSSRFAAPSEVAAETATRPGLLNAASRLEQLSTLGADAAGAPAAPYRLLSSGARSLLSPVATRVAETPAGQQLRNLGDSLMVTGRTEPLRQAMFGAQQQQAELTRPVVSAYQKLDELLPNPDDQRAFYSHLAGDPTVLAPLADRLSPVTFNDLVQGVSDKARIDITPEAAEKAVALSRRALPPEELSRFDQAAQLYRDQIAQPREDRYLQGFGESTVPTPERLASRADAATTTATLNTGQAPARFRNVLTLGETAASHIDTLLDATHDDATRNALQSVKGEIATTLDDALARGADPAYFPGGKLPMRRVGDASTTPMGLRRLGSERVKETAVGPRFNRGQAVLDAQRIRDQVSNQTARLIAEKMGVKAADRLELPEGATGAEIAAEMQRDGYVPWDPANPFKRLAPEEVTAETTFVPRAVEKGFARFRKPAGDWEMAARTLFDPPQRFFKAGVLALSPRWHVGNIVGNALMAAAGGVTPADLLRHWREGLEMTREGTGPRLLQGRGMTGDEATYLAGADELANSTVRSTEPRNRLTDIVESRFGEQSRLRPHAQRLDHPIQSSYAANQFVDNLGRNLFYLAKKAQGYSDEAAVTSALQTLGDFQRLLPWERQVMRRVFPFYAFTRHITQLAFRLSRDNPARVAWTLHLADTFQPEDNANDIPFLQGALPVGGDRFVPLARLSPFDTAADVFDPTDIGGNLSPLIKLPIEATTGYQVGRPGANILSPISRPPGTGSIDDYGRESPAGWLLDPRAALYRLSGVLPQTRLLRDYVGPYSEPVARFDTGEPIKLTLSSRFGTTRKTLPDEREPAADLARFVGVPFPETVDVDAIRQARRSRLKRLAAAAARA